MIANEERLAALERRLNAAESSDRQLKKQHAEA
jgi:hypothetical protein